MRGQVARFIRTANHFTAIVDVVREVVEGPAQGAKVDRPALLPQQRMDRLEVEQEAPVKGRTASRTVNHLAHSLIENATPSASFPVGSS